MKVEATKLPDVMLLEPSVFRDSRGLLFESWSERRFCDVTGADVRFVQDNYSQSSQNVLRGLHYQIRQAQGKLIQVIRGKIFDVAVDLRKSSVTFGRWAGAELSADDRRQLWIPAGFAHGFLVLSDTADVLYKMTDYYVPQHERCLLWNDPEVAIEWPLRGAPVLSAKDQAGIRLCQADVFA